ncbi:hypothetical protein HBH64_093200 [Parastagonospora nodorum]|nr:hypothetical protein HBH64_093200 [Parastagonospora nodorum]
MAAFWASLRALASAAAVALASFSAALAFFMRSRARISFALASFLGSLFFSDFLTRGALETLEPSSEGWEPE